MEPNLGMSQKGRKAVADGLAQLLANTYTTYLKTQNFHWNVIGSDFYALHLLFEKQYEELSEEVDEIAERIRALGFSVDATFSDLASSQKLKRKRACALLKICSNIWLKRTKPLFDSCVK